MQSQPASRVERKKEETTNKIITTAVALFNQQGIQATSMEQIAAAVDIARGTLYNYFPSREAIINAYLQRSFQQRNPDRLEQLRALPDTHARLTAVLNMLVAGVRANKEIFEAYMVYRMQQVISFRPVEGESSGLQSLVSEIIALGRQTGDLRADLPDDLLAGLFEYALIAAIKPFYLAPESYDAQAAIQRSVDMFLHGAGA
jgi:AcrR family transcriptional regulator